MKNLFKNSFPKKTGVTLIELLVAIGISSIVMLSVLTTIGNIYFSQKKIRFSQNFYTESRILMERIAQFARNNTIDYDRYFIEIGPDDTNSIAPATSTCANFAKEQQKDTANLPNTAANRAGSGSHINGYSSIFYWDTDADGNGTQDRNLGGINMNGVADPCTAAFHGTSQDVLYLINGARTLRTAIMNKNDYDIATDPTNDANEDYRIDMQRQLGADRDNDLIADIWGPLDANNDGDYDDGGDVKIIWDTTNGCELYWDENGNGSVENTEKISILGDKTSEDFCAKAYDWTSISPKLMKIDNLTFHPAPDRDPFLNFRVDEAQIHPHVFINLKTNVRDPGAHGFEVGQQPRLSFQTMVSSRIFGNTR